MSDDEPTKDARVWKPITGFDGQYSELPDEHIVVALLTRNDLERMMGCKFPSRKVKKGCKPRCGEQVHQSKLTDAKVAEIRAIYAAGGISYRKIALRFGVSGQACYDAGIGKTWAHVK